MALVRRQMKWSGSILVVLGVDFRSPSNQKLHQIALALQGRAMQDCPSALRGGVDVGSRVQQGFRLLGIAIAYCVKQLFISPLLSPEGGIPLNMTLNLTHEFGAKTGKSQVSRRLGVASSLRPLLLF